MSTIETAEKAIRNRELLTEARKAMLAKPTCRCGKKATILVNMDRGYSTHCRTCYEGIQARRSNPAAGRLGAYHERMRNRLRLVEVL